MGYQEDFDQINDAITLTEKRLIDLISKKKNLEKLLGKKPAPAVTFIYKVSEHELDIPPKETKEITGTIVSEEKGEFKTDPEPVPAPTQKKPGIFSKKTPKGKR